MPSTLFNSKLLNLLISGFAAFLFYQIFSLLNSWTQDTAVNALFRVFGGGDGGIVFLKIVMYIAFTYGILDLLEKRRGLRRENGGFSLSVLPEQDQFVIYSKDVEDIKLSVRDLEKRGFRFMVLDFVKKAATQFRNDNSVSDTIQVLEGQFDASKNEFEGDLETVRYLIQTIPMMGFVGTIVELTAALQQLGAKDDALNKVREAMSGAFDATMVALTLTMLLTFYYHQYIGALDMFFSRMKSYILENLISRIFQGGGVKSKA